MAKRTKTKCVDFMAGTTSNGWLVQRWGMSNDRRNPHNREFYKQEDAIAYAEDLNKRKINCEPAYGDEVAIIGSGDTCTCPKCPHCRKPYAKAR